MTSPRPSGSISLQITQPAPGPLAWIAGALLFFPGLGFLVADYLVAILAKQSPHTSHLAILAGIMVLGVLVPLGRYVLPVLARVVVIFGDYLPGGNRRSDKTTDELLRDRGASVTTVLPPTHPGIEDVELPPPNPSTPRGTR